MTDTAPGEDLGRTPPGTGQAPQGTEEAQQKARRPLRRVLGWVVGLVLLAFLLLALAHVFIRPIPPDQEAPAGHFGEPCVACHFVTASADPVSLP